MRSADFRAEQRECRFDAHIAPINEFVGTLQNLDGRGWLPEVAPLHGGIDARVLSILRDPGPKTLDDGGGSGFLCVENDDPTAETQAQLFSDRGIPLRTVLPWNAYPWYIDRKPRADELELGAEVLGRLVDLVPTLRVVLLQGKDAESVWKRLQKQRPSLQRNAFDRVAELLQAPPAK